MHNRLKTYQIELSTKRSEGEMKLDKLIQLLRRNNGKTDFKTSTVF